mmetsp:Transcript_26540/g.72935  ORF Transcript_26540/g.72935 Transcript_26540/m.72935 type:complete len:228 (+) Transcript_26540:2767-3450(+)
MLSQEEHVFLPTMILHLLAPQHLSVWCLTHAHALSHFHHCCHVWHLTSIPHTASALCHGLHHLLHTRHAAAAAAHSGHAHTGHTHTGHASHSRHAASGTASPSHGFHLHLDLLASSHLFEQFRVHLVQSLIDKVGVASHLRRESLLLSLCLLSDHARFAHFADHALELSMDLQEHLHLLGVSPGARRNSADARHGLWFVVVGKIDLAIELFVGHAVHHVKKLFEACV